MKTIILYSTYFLTITTWGLWSYGKAISLAENFKIERVIFNCGEFNNLEKDLIKVLDKYNVSNIDVLKVGHHGSNTSSSK